MADEEISELEKFLFKISQFQQIHSVDIDKPYTIQLDINETASWIIKFRKTGVLFNRRDLVFGGIVKFDAIFTLKNNSFFWQIINGTASVEEQIKQKNIHIEGSKEIINSFIQECIDTYQHFKQAVQNIPLRQSRIPDSNEAQPLKSGWLLKKRDILAGWRCRYFVVYAGRFDYYTDEHDVYPRTSVLLSGAEISGTKRVTINGVGEYWSIMIDTKNPDKSFRLASELTGMEGMVETNTWEQVFIEASKMSEIVKNENNSSHLLNNLLPFGNKNVRNSGKKNRNNTNTKKIAKFTGFFSTPSITTSPYIISGKKSINNNSNPEHSDSYDSPHNNSINSRESNGKMSTFYKFFHSFYGNIGLFMTKICLILAIVVGVMQREKIMVLDQWNLYASFAIVLILVVGLVKICSKMNKGDDNFVEGYPRIFESDIRH